MTQDARLRIVKAQGRDVGADAAAQRRCHGAKELARIQMGHDGVGHVEQQIQLIALALQDEQEIG